MQTFHYLQDITLNAPNYIYTCSPFDRVKIKAKIIEYLTLNPNAEIEHSKDNKTYKSFETLAFYKLNKQSKVCKIIFKGDREFLKPITK